MSNTKIRGPGIYKEEKTEASDKEWRNRRPQRINKEDAMEDKELPVDNVDKQIEANMVDIREQPHQDNFTESDPAISMTNWHNLPDLAFDAIMMMSSLTDLRKCSRVCRSWKEKITKNILENRTKKNIIRARIGRALGPGKRKPGVLGPGMFPSSEEIGNAKWLG